MANAMAIEAPREWVLAVGVKYVWTRIVGSAWNGRFQPGDEIVGGGPLSRQATVNGNAANPPPPPPRPGNGGPDNDDDSGYGGSSDCPLDSSNSSTESFPDIEDEDESPTEDDVQADSSTHSHYRSGSFFLSCSEEQEEEGEEYLRNHLHKAQGKPYRFAARTRSRRRPTRARHGSEESGLMKIAK